MAACAVVGLPDERLGERIAAAVVIEQASMLTVESLRETCLASLGRYKVPEQWLLVDALPRNAMGKIVKRDVLDLFD